MDFTYEYTYQDCEYIIRTMNIMHASALLYIQLVAKPYTCGFPAPGCKYDCALVLSTFVIKLLRQCYPALC